MASTCSIVGRGSTVRRKAHIRYSINEYTTITRIKAMPPYFLYWRITKGIVNMAAINGKSMQAHMIGCRYEERYLIT